METVISNDDRVAIAEVDYIIHHMNERYLKRIPQKLQDYITILKKRNIKIYVDPHAPLEKQGLKEFTLYFLMILNLKYWCDDARRKEILFMLENNQKKYDEKINNIFENAESIQGDNTPASTRPVNRPKQIVVTGAPTFSNKEENTATDNIEAIQEVKEKPKQISNALDDLAKQADAMTKVSTEENFFTKFINKIKSFFIKK